MASRYPAAQVGLAFLEAGLRDDGSELGSGVLKCSHAVFAPAGIAGNTLPESVSSFRALP